MSSSVSLRHVLARCYVSFRKGRAGGWALSHDKCESDGWWQMPRVSHQPANDKISSDIQKPILPKWKKTMQVANITTNLNILENREAHLSCGMVQHNHENTHDDVESWIAKFCTVWSCKVPFARTWFFAMLVPAPWIVLILRNETTLFLVGWSVHPTAR